MIGIKEIYEYIDGHGLDKNKFLFYSDGVMHFSDETTVEIDTELTEANAVYNSRLADVVVIETLFSTMAKALNRRTASTDGVRLRRTTDAGIDTQTDMYNLHRYAVSAGILAEEALTDAQKLAILTTVKFNTLLIRVTDMLSTKALAGEDWKTGYDAIKALKLEPSDLTEEKLAELTTMFLGV